jgi:hypothetical protein
MERGGKVQNTVRKVNSYDIGRNCRIMRNSFMHILVTNSYYIAILKSLEMEPIVSIIVL